MQFCLSKLNELSTKFTWHKRYFLQNSELDTLLPIRSLVLIVELPQAIQIQFVILINCCPIRSVGVLETNSLADNDGDSLSARDKLVRMGKEKVIFF